MHALSGRPHSQKARDGNPTRCTAQLGDIGMLHLSTSLTEFTNVRNTLLSCTVSGISIDICKFQSLRPS